MRISDWSSDVCSSDLGSPTFLTNIALSPAYAFIPRVIWKEKPSGDLGLWYTHVVMGLGSYSSTAMGPVTYLYFAGGALAVFVGFMGFGILQKVLLDRKSVVQGKRVSVRVDLGG